MREHSCRYGFIMTEIELVCVRAGTDSIPYFGFPRTRPDHRDEDANGLTACLALWYLHMVAKEQPLLGALLAIGRRRAGRDDEATLSGKDAWIPEPQVGEKRDAKRPGGVMPSDRGIRGRRAERVGTSSVCRSRLDPVRL
jgi:hypothetical protein